MLNPTMQAADAQAFVETTGWRVEEVVLPHDLAPGVVTHDALDLAGINPEACAVDARKDERSGRDHLQTGGTG